MPEPPVCDYEDSDYQASFWDQGGREYEDRVEAVALKRLLPRPGRLMLEVGAGAGRNTARYGGYERVVLLDYSITQLEQAQTRLGKSEMYVYVAADAYHLPFIEGLFDAATMIRVLHHMADAPRALAQVRDVLSPNGTFLLEFANKRNAKAVLRYLFGRQSWNPFTLEPVEFAALNFDFHPAAVRGWLRQLGFEIQKTLTVSHFRAGVLKRVVPIGVLVLLDSALQWTGEFWQLTPSVFTRARLRASGSETPSMPAQLIGFFKCPSCGHRPLLERPGFLECNNCGREWPVRGEVFDFRLPPAKESAAQH
jgi:ubiquinone/menaquinone biosynthesis C-methylase UbiE